MLNITHRLFLRKIWLKVHLWLALTAGILFVLIGLSGSLSIYREGIDEWLNPHLIIENPQGHWQSLDKIMTEVKKAHPTRYGSWTLEMPRNKHSMMIAWFDKPKETYFELYAPLMVSINPYTAEIVDSRFWGQTLTTWVLDVHTQLLLNRSGWTMVGMAGILLTISVCSGMYLWWPRLANLRVAFRIDYRKTVIKLLFDTHRVTGLLIAPALLFLAITGFLLSYSSDLEKLIGSSGMAHGETGKSIASTATPNDHPTALESAEFMARGSFPRSTLRRVTTPAGETGIYRINLRQPFEINERHPYTTVWVDRWSGQVKEVRDPARFGRGERFMTMLWPLHTGEALGNKGRLLWFFAGLGLPFLYISGVLRWLHRTGKIQDKPIDVVAVKAVAQQQLLVLQPTLIRVQQAILQGAKTAYPSIQKAWFVLLQWLKQFYLDFLKGQKRIGRD